MIDVICLVVIAACGFFVYKQFKAKPPVAVLPVTVAAPVTSTPPAA